MRVFLVPCHICQDTRSINTTNTYSVNGSNSSGFNGKPGGFREYVGTFHAINSIATWWSSTDYSYYGAWSWEIDSDFLLGIYLTQNDGKYGNKGEGYSVRCIKNESKAENLDDNSKVKNILNEEKTNDSKINLNETNIKDNNPNIEVIDGTRAVKIGTQIWSVENLNLDKFRNGDIILQANSESDWITAGENKQPAWCYYNNDLSNGSIYGRIYNFFAVADSRGLCPASWHVPTDEEWNSLTEFLGGNTIAGSKMKEIGIKNWNSPNEDANNSSGFTGLPGGYRNRGGNFMYIGTNGFWWTAPLESTYIRFIRNLNNRSEYLTRTSVLSSYGMHVRCVKD